ncbi:MAG: sigma-70 family RNA polymerase sigma factor [Gemmatimonadales bacterium]|jgi:RNA polymerase sigma-70 factor (ECF subfamily)|nr:MAG: sigma-70 family RNA polymerase sigma factor [Gemmatimonadales bacterium]
MDSRDGPDTPDEVLVDQARSGNEAALDRLVSRHHGTAYRVALGILRDPDMAADAAQDGFLKAIRALDRFRGEARFRTWLLTIVSNEAKGQLRKKGRRREAVLDDVTLVADRGVPVDDAVVAVEEARRARRLLQELPDKQRLAVQLRLDEGLSFREVGELIGSSEGAARVNYHHGIRRLRERMERP